MELNKDLIEQKMFSYLDKIFQKHKKKQIRGAKLVQNHLFKKKITMNITLCLHIIQIIAI